MNNTVTMKTSMEIPLKTSKLSFDPNIQATPLYTPEKRSVECTTEMHAYVYCSAIPEQLSCGGSLGACQQMNG